jgi:hypothetical protein
MQFVARHVLSNGGGDASYLLQLIEELCRQNDKLMDDARKEREDLQQQVKFDLLCSLEMRRCMISDYSILVCQYSDEYCNAFIENLSL